MSDAAAAFAGTLVNGPVPKHAQLRELLRHAIEHELPAGTLIPSERALALHYAVSRLTVRSAIGRLVDEGMLARIRGKGTFTAARRMELRLYLMSFTNDMSRRGLVPSTELLHTSSRTPPAPTAADLRLADGEQAYRLERLRKADGIPLAVERGWYRRHELPGMLELDLTRSLYTQLAEHYGIRFERAWQTVWSEAADRDTATLLGVRAGTPLLAFRRLSSSAGVPIEDMTSWYRGEHYQVTMQLEGDSQGFVHNELKVAAAARGGAGFSTTYPRPEPGGSGHLANDGGSR